MSANPQAAKDETMVLRDLFAPSGRTVPFEHGWSWVTEAWSIFTKAPGVWVLMTLMLLVFNVVFSVATLAGGSIVTVLASPVFTGGLMMTARTIGQGGEPQFNQLFAGFKHRFGALLAIGAIYLVGLAAILLVAGLSTGVGVMAMLHATSPEEIMAIGASLLLAALVFLALALPLLMAVWFAPALVVFHDLDALAAMKASFVGCLRNVMPFLLYGIVMLIPSILASIPALLGWLVLGPITMASIYTAYRDIYFTS